MKTNEWFWTIITIGVIGVALFVVPPTVGLVLNIIADAGAIDFIVVMSIMLVGWGVRYEYEYLTHKKSHALLVSGVVLATLSAVIILTCLFQDTLLNLAIAFANYRVRYMTEFKVIRTIGLGLIILAIGMMASLLILRVNKHKYRKERKSNEEEALEEEEDEPSEEDVRVMTKFYCNFLDYDETYDNQSHQDDHLM